MLEDLERIRRFLRAENGERRTLDQRRFAYIACISALYSIFENFAERVAFRFCQMMLSTPTNLTDEQMTLLRRRYVKNAAALLGQSLGTGRYQDVTEVDVARSLVSCLDDRVGTFELRLELVTLHNSNLRWDPLAELFRWAIPDVQSRIQRSDAVVSWAESSKAVGDTTLTSELDDLIERRNEVAHRAIPEEILSYERLLEKADFVDALSLGLIASLAEVVLGLSLKNGETHPVGIPTEYYKSSRVVVISSPTSTVSTGDTILAVTATSMTWGRVLEVRASDVTVASAPAGEEVGLLLDFACRKGAHLHVWHTPNADLANPPAGLFGKRGPFEES